MEGKEKSAKGPEIEKFSIGLSDVTLIPQDGKYKGMKLFPGWRSFDTFDLRNNLMTENGEKVPVTELDGVDVEIIREEN